MNNETGVQASGPKAALLHTLISLEDFKAILCLDGREDFISRYCLTTATYTIESYCRRRLVKKINNEQGTMNNGEILIPLREYPVRKIIMVHAVSTGAIQGGDVLVSPEHLVDPSHYYCVPDAGIREDIPFSLVLRPPPRPSREDIRIRVRYAAGYGRGKAPADLASACLELAAWNMSRYRGRRIGMTGNVRGNAKDGEHLEASMPENVRLLLEPYRRRTI